MTPRPNILIILADDLGYSDLGCYGAEIQTPNIDRLAKEGLSFSDYHTSPLCGPTRAMLLSGTDCHLAGLGVMNENTWSNSEWRSRPGFEGYMNHDVVALPELLQDDGYVTMLSGKWHVGYKRGHIPCDRGFKHSLSMLCGAQNHFGWTPDWKSVQLDKQGIVGSHNAPIYVKGDKRWLPTPNTTDDPQGYYSSDCFADTLIAFLRDTATVRAADSKPFFAYLPFTAPHQPIQCYKTDRDKYKGVYDEGPDVLRKQRLEQLSRLGFIDPDVVPHEILASSKPWAELSPQAKQLSARSYECYAGMVEALDRASGRVIDYLRDSKELDDTLVMVFSDNGPEGGGSGRDEVSLSETGHHELEDILGPDIDESIKTYFDNSYENHGAYNSFPRPGARWAQASTAPNRLYKHVTSEGGIRVPLVIRYPPFVRHHLPGSICHAFTTVMDIMPTVLSLTGTSHPNSAPATPVTKAPWREYQVYPMRGRDWVPYLRDGQRTQHEPTSHQLAEQTQLLVGRKKLFIAPGEDEAIWGPDSDAVGWEMHGRAGLRKGNWKILNLTADFWGTEKWELYDLNSDQGETTDVAGLYPNKLDELIGYWDKYQRETGAYLRREHPEMPPPIRDPDFRARPGQDAWMWVPLGETLSVSGSERAQ